MTDYSEKDLEFALDAIQDSKIRNSKEFKEWIKKEENQKLFIELMAGKEAILRERHLKKSRFKKRARIISLISTAAAIAAFAIYLPDFFHHTPSLKTNQDIHFFIANANINEVVLEMEEKKPEIIKDSFIAIPPSTTENVTEDEIKYQTIKTPRGKDFHIKLSDGTEVWLNAETSLKFPNAFTGKERRVLLSGEAFFNVAHNDKCPFIVCTEGIETKVLGTKFNVCSYTKEQRHITLVEGKVEVNNNNSKESTVLSPGQNITYNSKDKSQINRVNTAVYTAWTEGMFYFEDKPLKEIMNTIGRWYNVDIYFENEELYNITFNFWASRNSNINDAIALLNDLGKVKIEITDDNKITVKKNK